MRRKGESDGGGKGKGKALDGGNAVECGDGEREKSRDAVVVFACGHLAHRGCLDRADIDERDGKGRRVRAGGSGGFGCPACER